MPHENWWDIGTELYKQFGILDLLCLYGKTMIYVHVCVMNMACLSFEIKELPT